MADAGDAPSSRQGSEGNDRGHHVAEDADEEEAEAEAEEAAAEADMDDQDLDVDADDEGDAEESESERRRTRRGGMSFPQRLLQRFTEEAVKLRVHDVKIQGNLRTKDSVIEAELESVKAAQNSQDLLREVAMAIARLQGLGIFEECVISLEPGPVELPGTANVLVIVKEPESFYSGDVGVYSKPEVRASSPNRCMLLPCFFTGVQSASLSI
jgi:outer membrane protein insertion porin family